MSKVVLALGDTAIPSDDLLALQHAGLIELSTRPAALTLLLAGPEGDLATRLDIPASDLMPSVGMPAVRRRDFDLPRDVVYLNAAGFGLLSRAARDAGKEACATQARAWLVDKTILAAQADDVRQAAARLVGAAPGDVAIVDAVSQAMAIAVRGVTIEPNSRVVMMAGEHPSAALIWSAAAQAAAATVESVPMPDDGDWTTALLETLAPGPAKSKVSVVAVSAVHWGDGGVIDLGAVGEAARLQGAALVIDATHAAGVVEIDVSQTPADFIAFPLFKWLLGPYGMAFLYVAPARQQGEPIERHAINCRLGPGLSFAGFVDGAARYDRGERDDPVALAIATTALAEAARPSVAAVGAYGRALASDIAEILRERDYRLIGKPGRSHIICAEPPVRSAAEIVRCLAAEGVHIAERLGRLRFSPHVYNDAEDLTHLASALKRI